MNIIDVLEQEGVEMVDKGEYWQGICPLHGDSKPSLVVYKTGNKFHCFGCGGRGDAIDFIRLLKKISFTESVNYLKLSHDKSKVFIPYPKLIDVIAEQEQKGVDVKSQYKELLIAMGFLVEGKNGKQQKD